MGLTFKRIGFGALVLAAVLLPLRKPAPLHLAETTGNRAARLDTLSWANHAAHLSWSAFDLIDSTTAILARTPVATARPTITWRGFPGPVMNTEADSIVTGLWQQIGTASPGVRVSVLIYNQEAYRAPSYIGALVTRHGDRTDCVAISPGRITLGERTVSVWQGELGDALAPCALLAAFGPPGAGVGNWLSATRYASARSNGWLIPRTSQFSEGPWVEWDNTRGRHDWPDGLTLFMAQIGVLDLARLMQPPYDYGAVGVRCITGSESDCMTGVLHSATAFPPADAMPVELTQPAWRPISEVTTIGTIRPATRGMMAGLINDFGRARFEKFWTSAQPFDVAFREAFNISLGAWTARWADREWRRTYNARFVNADILLGVTLKPSWLPLILGWSAVAVLVAVRVAKRRTA